MDSVVSLIAPAFVFLYTAATFKTFPSIFASANVPSSSSTAAMRPFFTEPDTYSKISESNGTFIWMVVINFFSSLDTVDSNLSRFTLTVTTSPAFKAFLSVVMDTSISLSAEAITDVTPIEPTTRHIVSRIAHNFLPFIRVPLSFAIFLVRIRLSIL